MLIREIGRWWWRRWRGGEILIGKSNENYTVTGRPNAVTPADTATLYITNTAMKQFI